MNKNCVETVLKMSVPPDISYITPDLRPLAVPIDSLHIDPHNARWNHAIDETSESLAIYGQRKPVVVNRLEGNKIEAGNGTWQSAKKLGWAYIAAVFVEDDPATATGYAIADNRTAELSGWKHEQLIKSLQSLPPTMPTGFSQKALDELLKRVTAPNGASPKVGETAGVERGQELRDKWDVQPGQVWALGNHRVICGDCREAATWERVTAGELVNCVFTSPPYAMQRKESYGGVPADEYVAWFAAVQANAEKFLAADGSFFLNIKPHTEDGRRVLYVFDLVLAMCRKWGWLLIDELCWVDQGLPGKFPNRFKNAFEPIYHFAQQKDVKIFPEAVIRPFSENSKVGGPSYVTKNTDHQWHLRNNAASGQFDGALPSNVLQINTGITAAYSGAYHGATFPPALPEFFVKAFSAADDIVCDPFLGSGTTLIACQRNGRRCHGIEIKPEYVGVVLERWHMETGNVPELIV